MKHAPVTGELLQIEYAWLAVQYERLVHKLGLCCMTPGDYAAARAIIDRSFGQASPAAMRAARSARIDLTLDYNSGRLLAIDGVPWVDPGPD